MQSNIKLITLSNNGYMHYTMNCINSLTKRGLHNYEVYTIGEKSYKYFKKYKLHTILLNDSENLGFQTFRTGNWSRITFKKFEIISECLKHFDLVLFFDGDIVFKKDGLLEYLNTEIKEFDMLIQNDTLHDSSNEILCSGFMYIKSNKRTRKFFDPNEIKQKSDINETWDDQVYVNLNKAKLQIKKLPLALFPNGQFYGKSKIFSPYIIHFNWLKGHKKAIQMLKRREVYSVNFLFFVIQQRILRSRFSWLLLSK
jgi:hypothetical protein